MLRVFVAMPASVTQRQIARTVLAERGIARLAELRNAGVTAATMSRMERDGEVVRLNRGLYQLPNAELDANHSLAEIAKRVPKALVCLVSALAFHGLGPTTERPSMCIVRFTDSLLNESVETHVAKRSQKSRCLGARSPVATRQGKRAKLDLVLTRFCA